MPRTIRVEVTEEDIRLGGRCESRFCALARALNRAAPDLEFQVTGQQAHYFRRGRCAESRHVWLPDDAAKFVADFDSGRPVQPFAFEAELVL